MIRIVPLPHARFEFELIFIRLYQSARSVTMHRCSDSPHSYSHVTSLLTHRQTSCRSIDLTHLHLHHRHPHHQTLPVHPILVIHVCMQLQRPRVVRPLKNPSRRANVRRHRAHNRSRSLLRKTHLAFPLTNSYSNTPTMFANYIHYR